MTQQKYYKALNIEEVKKLLDENFKFNPKIEKISLIEADGRILAENIYSNIDVPHFNRAMRDGFAVRAEDTFNADEENPVKLKIIENIFAGNIPTKTIGTNECIQIATGAPIPDGANAVVMIEYTNLLDDDVVEIYKPVVPEQYIIKIGNDIKKNTKVLEEKCRLNPRNIGTLAAIGKKNIKVYSLPKIALFSTGNEIISLEEELKLGKVYDINSYTLLLSLKRTGAIITFMGILPDVSKIAKQSLIETFRENDLVILSGGTSKGIGDIFPSIIQELGKVELFIHGIRVKPGKPTLFASIRVEGASKLITMLPGYPTSALMIFDLFLKELVMRWSQISIIPQKTLNANLHERVYSELGRIEFKTVKILRENNRYLAIPTKTGSDAISTLVCSDGFFMIPEQVQIVEEGEEIKVFLFD